MGLAVLAPLRGAEWSKRHLDVDLRPTEHVVYQTHPPLGFYIRSAAYFGPHSSYRTTHLVDLRPLPLDPHRPPPPPRHRLAIAVPWGGLLPRVKCLGSSVCSVSSESVKGFSWMAESNWWLSSL